MNYLLMNSMAHDSVHIVAERALSHCATIHHTTITSYHTCYMTTGTVASLSYSFIFLFTLKLKLSLSLNPRPKEVLTPQLSRALHSHTTYLSRRDAMQCKTSKLTETDRGISQIEGTHRHPISSVPTPC